MGGADQEGLGGLIPSCGVLLCGQGTAALSPISMHALTLGHVICLRTYDIKNRRQVLPSCVTGSRRRGTFMRTMAPQSLIDVC